VTAVAQGLPTLLDAEALRAAGPRLLRALAAYDAVHAPAARGLSIEAGLALAGAGTDFEGRDVAVSPTSGAPAAIGVLAPLAFDSEIFGVPMGRIERFLVPPSSAADGRALLQEILRAAEARGLRHLTCRVPCADHPAALRLQERGFAVMTVFIGLQYPLARSQTTWGREPGVRPTAPGDLPAILAITREAFGQGTHFHADPSLAGEAATRLHERWAENCCARRAADAVFVADAGGAVTGFISCQILPATRAVPERARGVIPLVAVAPAHRGRGVGKALVRRALAWFASQGLAFADIGTESFNYPALNAYVGAGFQIALSAFWFHRARPEGGWT
jgi:ribosomal protein S18 acetylase RimI-like enzyme